MALFGFPSTLLGWMANMGIGHISAGSNFMVPKGLNGFCTDFGHIVPDSETLPGRSLPSRPDPVQSTESSIRLTFQYGDMACNIIHPRRIGRICLNVSPYSLKELKDMVEKAWVYVLIVFPAVFAWEVYNRGHECIVPLHGSAVDSVVFLVGDAVFPGNFRLFAHALGLPSFLYMPPILWCIAS